MMQNERIKTNPNISHIINFSLFTRDEFGQTRIHRAVRSGDVITLKTIICTWFINFNEKDKNGRTPLHIAAQNGYVGSLRVLLSLRCINLNIQNRFGNAPLHRANLRCHLDCVWALLAHPCISLSLDNNLHESVFDVAAISNQPQCLNILLQRSYYLKSRKDAFPLHHCILSNNIAQIAHILKRKQ